MHAIFLKHSAFFSMTNSPDRFAADQQFFPTNTAQLMRWLPWLRMFQAFRIAIDYKKMFVATMAVLLIQFSTDQFLDAYRHQTATRSIKTTSSHGLLGSESGQNTLVPPEKPRFKTVSIRLLLSPIRPLLEIYHWGMKTFTAPTTGGRLLSGLGVLFLLVAFSIFGGAICRMAALDVTANNRSLIRDCKYAFRKFPAAFLAPTFATLFALIFFVMNFLAGLLGRVPVVGEVLLGVSWIIWFGVGLVMTLLLIGLTLGWPLMIASTAVERNDAGDAMSRSLGYLWTQPWYAIFLFLITALSGAVLVFLMGWLTHNSGLMTFASVGAGMGWEEAMLDVKSPAILNERGLQLIENPAGQWFLKFWLSLIGQIPSAFAFSFFWCSVTIGYLLLRRCEDGTPLDVIDLSDQNSADPALPVVGIPAAELREAKENQAN